ncbi:MAG: HD domain-containing protein [Firmicutes bacterium]|nr:HD domain-containing protein [Bacillota bacterium]
MILTQENRQEIQSRFLQYISGYDLEDPKIRLKMDHSFRVAGLCERIAASGTEAGPDLAWLIGLLHDIGRFEQIRRYGTFVDARSVDHAKLGADLLFQEGLLDQITGSILTAQEQAIMETSIRNHNRYRIEEGLPELTTEYCSILRDADKIDIFRVLCDTPVEEIYDVTSNQLRRAKVTEAVKECFHRRRAVPRPIKKTPVDNIVGHICLFFELVYPVSRQIAMDQDYLVRLLRFSSENPQTQEWFQYMRKVLDGRRVEE